MIYNEGKKFRQEVVPHKILYSLEGYHMIVAPLLQDKHAMLIQNLIRGNESNLIYEGIPIQKLYCDGEPFGDNLDKSGHDYIMVIHALLPKNRRLYMPVGYDFSKQTFKIYYTKENKPFNKYEEVDILTYYRYCISLIGNPKNVIIFKTGIYFYDNYYKPNKQ